MDLATVLHVVSKTVLASVFVLSGTMKMLGRKRFSDTLSTIGLGDKLTPIVTLLLITVELLTAALLLTNGTAQTIGSFLSIALLALFTAAAAYFATRNKVVPCSCFGSLSDEPMGWRTAGRNALLVALAITILLLQSSAQRFSVLQFLIFGRSIEYSGIPVGDLGLLPFLFVLCMSMFFYRSLAQFRTIHSYEDDIVGNSSVSVNQKVPAFALPNLDGSSVELQDMLSQRKPVLLCFVMPDCYGCELALKTRDGWREEDLQHVSKLAKYKTKFVLLEDAIGVGEVSMLYGISVWPSFGIVRPNGTLFSSFSTTLPSFPSISAAAYDHALHGTPEEARFVEP